MYMADSDSYIFNPENKCLDILYPMIPQQKYVYQGLQKEQNEN